MVIKTISGQYSNYDVMNDRQNMANNDKQKIMYFL